LTTRYIAETKWRVQLQTGAPTLQSFEKVLDAPSQEIAIHRASAMFPNVQFIQVQATQLDPQTGGPTQQQNTNTPTGTGQLPGFKPLQPLQGLNPGWPANAQQQQESKLPVNPRWFTYPYSISLPGRFQQTLRETSPVTVHSHDGHHSIILESVSEMRGFLTNLIRHVDRDAARTIVAGIRSSMG
jgi:hypothetical protein